MAAIKEGWGFPGTYRKAHYFVDGMSLCRKWCFYHGPLEQGEDDHPDNCVACMRKLAKRKIKQRSEAERKKDN